MWANNIGQTDLRLDMSSISGGMSLSLLLLRTRVSRLAILLMLSGSFSSWFLWSHRVCSFSILKTDIPQCSVADGRRRQSSDDCHCIPSPTCVCLQVSAAIGFLPCQATRALAVQPRSPACRWSHSWTGPGAAASSGSSAEVQRTKQTSDQSSL